MTPFFLHENTRRRCIAVALIQTNIVDSLATTQRKKYRNNEHKFLRQSLYPSCTSNIKPVFNDAFV